MRQLLFLRFSLFANNWNKQIIKRTQSGLHFTFNAILKTCKNVPCTRCEALLLTKKMCLTIRHFSKALWLLYGVHELHCGISVNEKNTLASILKRLVTWKRDLPRPKFFIGNFIPSPILSYTITKKQKRGFLRHRSRWGSWSAWESLLIAFIFRFHSDSVL